MSNASLFKKLFALLNPAITIHCGYSCLGNNPRYVYTAHKKTGPIAILHTSQKPSLLLSPIAPILIHADLGCTVTLYKRTLSDGIDPQVFIDQHEHEFTPTGLTSQEVITEWYSTEECIAGASVTQKAYDTALAAICGKKRIAQILSIPLCNLAELYAKNITNPFVLWHVDASCSVVGTVVDGELLALSNVWAGSVDVTADPASVCAYLQQLLQTMNGYDRSMPIILYCADASWEMPSVEKLQGLALAAVPDIEGVPYDYHCAFANASSIKPGINVSPWDHVQYAKKVNHDRKAVLSIINKALWACLFMCLLFAGVYGITTLLQQRLNTRLKPVAANITHLRLLVDQSDSLQKSMAHDLVFYTRQSALTLLLNNLQTAFPDGIRAEQISIVEAQTGWQVDIVAAALSTDPIPGCLENLRGIAGATDVRMEYSEQLKDERNKGQKVVKFKAKFTYKHGS